METEFSKSFLGSMSKIELKELMVTFPETFETGMDVYRQINLHGLLPTDQKSHNDSVVIEKDWVDLYGLNTVGSKFNVFSKYNKPFIRLNIPTKDLDGNYFMLIEVLCGEDDYYVVGDITAKVMTMFNLEYVKLAY